MGLLARLLWPGGALVGAAGATELLTRRGEVLRAYYGDKEYQRKYASMTGTLTGAAEAAGWYFGVTGLLGISPGLWLGKKVLGAAGGAKTILRIPSDLASSRGILKRMIESKRAEILRPKSALRTRAKLEKRFAGVVKRLRVEQRQYRRQVWGRIGIGRTPQARRRRSFLMGAGIVLGAGYAGAYARVPPRIGEGNITSFGPGAAYDKLNFSTTGLTQALHSSRRRED